MTELIEIELQLPERVITVRVDAEADPVNGTNAVTRLVIGGLLERTRTASHARLTKKAQAALPEDLKADLADYPDAYAVYRWLRDNALSISGTPERAAYEAQCASTDPHHADRACRSGDRRDPALHHDPHAGDLQG